MKESIRLPKSLRIFIRREKRKIRRNYGEHSAKEQELLDIAGKTRQKKEALYKKNNK